MVGNPKIEYCLQESPQVDSLPSSPSPVTSPTLDLNLHRKISSDFTKCLAFFVSGFLSLTVPATWNSLSPVLKWDKRASSNNHLIGY